MIGTQGDPVVYKPLTIGPESCSPVAPKKKKKTLISPGYQLWWARPTLNDPSLS